MKIISVIFQVKSLFSTLARCRNSRVHIAATGFIRAEASYLGQVFQPAPHKEPRKSRSSPQIQTPNRLGLLIKSRRPNRLIRPCLSHLASFGAIRNGRRQYSHLQELPSTLRLHGQPVKRGGPELAKPLVAFPAALGAGKASGVGGGLVSAPKLRDEAELKKSETLTARTSEATAIDLGPILLILRPSLLPPSNEWGPVSPRRLSHNEREKHTRYLALKNSIW